MISNRLRRGALLPVALAAALLGSLVAVTPAQALTVQRAWHAVLRANGASLTVTLRAYRGDTGVILIGGTGVAAGSQAVALHAGSCSSPRVIVRLTPLAVASSGSVSRSTKIGKIVMGKLWAAAGKGAIGVQVGSGGSSMCATLKFSVATRIVISSYGIDLPVIIGPRGFPPCNVAMYLRELWQPREPGVTFLYAHAREGMFLPLLKASWVNNGKALIGKRVLVYTDDGVVSTYEISRVRRHVITLDGIFDVTAEQLWIQTSEGPRGTYEKLILVARRVSSAPAGDALAVPVPHPIYCS